MILDNRLLMLLIGGTAVVILIALYKASAFALDVIAVMHQHDKGGEIRTHGNAVSGVYTVLSVRDYYDEMQQGIWILCERQNGGQSVFWMSYDPLCAESSPQPFFFDVLAPGDCISIQVDEDAVVRTMSYMADMSRPDWRHLKNPVLALMPDQRQFSLQGCLFYACIALRTRVFPLSGTCNHTPYFQWT